MFVREAPLAIAETLIIQMGRTQGLPICDMRILSILMAVLLFGVSQLYRHSSQATRNAIS